MEKEVQTPTKPNLFTPFTDEHEIFRESVRSFMEKELNPHVNEWEEAEI